VKNRILHIGGNGYKSGKQGAFVPRKLRKPTTESRSSCMSKEDSLARRRMEERMEPHNVAAAETPELGGVAHCINNPANSILLDSQSLAKIWGLVFPILDEKAGKDDCFFIAGYSFKELKQDMNNLFARIERNARRVKCIVDGLQ
jgi:hypothetical protein